MEKIENKDKKLFQIECGMVRGFAWGEDYKEAFKFLFAQSRFKELATMLRFREGNRYNAYKPETHWKYIKAAELLK